MSPKEIALRLLEETVAHYHLGNRAKLASEPYCFYARKDDERRCAVGRIMTPEAIEYILEKNEQWGLSALVSEWRKSGRSGPLLIAPYDELLKTSWGLRILNNIQDLHDLSSNWAATGPSAQGKYRADVIRKMIETE